MYLGEKKRTNRETISSNAERQELWVVKQQARSDVPEGLKDRLNIWPTQNCIGCDYFPVTQISVN